MESCNSDISNLAEEKVNFLVDVCEKQQERCSEISYYVSDSFKDVLINNSFNLQYIIINPLFTTI